MLGEQKLRNPRFIFSLAYPECLVSLLEPTVVIVAETRFVVMYRSRPVLRADPMIWIVVAQQANVLQERDGIEDYQNRCWRSKVF